MKLAKLFSVAIVFSLVASMALAQPGGGGRGGRGGRGGGMGGGVMLLASDDSPLKRLSDAIDKLELTDDQKSKIADIKKDAEPKIKDAKDKLVASLTDDQKKAVEEGKKKIKDATGQDQFTAMRDFRTAVTLTSDQQKIAQEAGSAVNDARTKILAVLTDEQKTKLGPMAGGGGRGNRGGGRGGRGGGGGGGNGGTTNSREST
jgi:hypothetical protein